MSYRKKKVPARLKLHTISIDKPSDSIGNIIQREKKQNDD